MSYIEKTPENGKRTKIMKFDYCIMNPPYAKNLHLKFMEKTFEVISENGALVYIGPDKWIINKYGFAEKSILRKNARDKYAKYIDSIETFGAEEFNKYFGTNNSFGVSIFKMKHNAKGLNLEDYQSKDELLNGIIEKITNKFSSLRSHFVRKTDDKLFVSIRRTNHGYLNWVERDGKNNAKDGILFDTENEKNNFISSFDTWLYQYLNCTDWLGAENSAYVPYLNDYTSKWTNDKLFKLFEIDKENQKYILNLIKDKNPWKL